MPKITWREVLGSFELVELDELDELDARVTRARSTLVLGCIEAKIYKKICVGKLSLRSTQCTPLHRFGIHNRKLGKKGPGQYNTVLYSQMFDLKTAELFAFCCQFCQILLDFAQILCPNFFGRLK